MKMRNTDTSFVDPGSQMWRRRRHMVHTQYTERYFAMQILAKYGLAQLFSFARFSV